MKRIDYYFDFLSPYSYFSWINSESLRKRDDLEIHLKPVVMGSLFNHWEMKGPGEIWPKRVYMLKQCFIYAAQNNIAFNPPKSHPFNPLYALRLATKECAGKDQEKIIDYLWKLCWQEGYELGDSDFLGLKLSEIGLDGKSLLDKTFDRQVKKELKSNIKEAIAKDVFGVPSFIYQDELYWGNDSIKNLKLSLENKMPQWDQKTFEDRIS